jgi:pyrrolidone-carboxylate peptidase
MARDDPSRGPSNHGAQESTSADRGHRPYRKTIRAWRTAKLYFSRVPIKHVLATTVDAGMPN